MKKPESEGEYTTTSPQMLSSDRDQNQAETTAMLGGRERKPENTGANKDRRPSRNQLQTKTKKRKKAGKWAEFTDQTDSLRAFAESEE